MKNPVYIDIFSIDFFFYGQLLYYFINSTPTLTLQICQCLTQFSLDIFLFYVKICLFLHHFGPKIRKFLQFYQKIFIKYLIFVKKSIKFLHVFDYFLTDREEFFFPAKDSDISLIIQEQQGHTILLRLCSPFIRNQTVLKRATLSQERVHILT